AGATRRQKRMASDEGVPGVTGSGALRQLQVKLGAARSLAQIREQPHPYAHRAESSREPRRHARTLCETDYTDLGRGRSPRTCRQIVSDVRSTTCASRSSTTAT